MLWCFHIQKKVKLIIDYVTLRLAILAIIMSHLRIYILIQRLYKSIFNPFIISHLSIYINSLIHLLLQLINK